MGAAPDVSLQSLGSGGISEPQRGSTVAVGIMGAARYARFSVLPKRLPLSISVLALARESVDVEFFIDALMASIFGLVRASAKISFSI